MIPNPNKNQKIPNNHRAISQLNTIAKVFEIVILFRLKITILEKILPEHHFTTSQLVKLVDYLTNITNIKETICLENTFDKVWHKALLFKLLELGTQSDLTAIIKLFLKGRS